MKRSPKQSPRRSRSRKASPKKRSGRSHQRSHQRKKVSPKRKASKSPVRIHLTKDSLGKYGYKNIVDTPASERRKALAKALKHEDALPIFKKLNALYIMNKNRHPATAAVFESDRNWVKTNYDV